MQEESPFNSPDLQNIQERERMSEHSVHSPLIQKIVPDQSLDTTGRINSKTPFHITYYSGYSSFKNKFSIKSTYPQADILNNVQSQSGQNNPVDIELEKPVKVEDCPQNANLSAQKGMNETNKDEAVERVQQSGVVKGTRKMYQFSRVIKNWDGDKKKSMIKKLTRGIWSISSRKYNPNEALRQIFDEEQLASNTVGLDQCKLWMYLMNKYIQKPKSKKIKLKKQAVSSNIQAQNVQKQKDEPEKKERKKNKKKNKLDSNLLIEEGVKMEELIPPESKKKMKQIDAVPWNNNQAVPEDKVKLEVKQEWIDNEQEKQTKKKGKAKGSKKIQKKEK